MITRTEFDEIGDELARLKYQLMGIKVELKLRRLSFASKAGFDPDQPRDEDGRWTDGDTGSQPDSVAEEYIEPVIAELQEIAWGHHKVPRGVFNREKYGFPDDVLDVFKMPRPANSTTQAAITSMSCIETIIKQWRSVSTIFSKEMGFEGVK